MHRSAELESLAMRLANRANSPLLQGQPEMQSDMKAAADVVQDYVAILRAAGKGGLLSRDIGRELAELLCPSERLARLAPPCHGLRRRIARFRGR
jgi:hypothetical protein